MLCLHKSRSWVMRKYWLNSVLTMWNLESYFKLHSWRHGSLKWTFIKEHLPRAELGEPDRLETQGCQVNTGEKIRKQRWVHSCSRSWHQNPAPGCSNKLGAGSQHQSEQEPKCLHKQDNPVKSHKKTGSRQLRRCLGLQYTTAHMGHILHNNKRVFLWLCLLQTSPASYFALSLATIECPILTVAKLAWLSTPAALGRWAILHRSQ